MPLRILIVDDEPLVRLGMRMLVEQHKDWTVCGEACDGEDAIHKAGELNPNLVLLDVSMPKLNGLAAAPLIRQKAPQAKIVLFSMHDTAQMERAATRVGAVGFISKALLVTDLARTIEALHAAEPGGIPPPTPAPGTA